MPQSSNPAYEYSVFDVVLMGALHKGSIFSSFSKSDEILATRNLEKLGILHLKNEAYTKISGGERQLTYIARALTQEARIIFMDEPTNGLDFGNQIKLLEMIKWLKNEGKTIVLPPTTHATQNLFQIGFCF
ncbi:ATP-binding cassette domain-containing protein [Campylobacter gastrosuis]|uniref:ABC transporter ATP-binding protein n=1 Tax=Campylobacter gastrosuis TaxID=2974576 RepID=A0ABT7HT95_9BACT|nr:ABC transporter ATP-binding protein [Campylobacter gastrosuis]MDL0089599.1 ABC transporter ATP-binding protein [Campylobacter gastrosuis]